MDPLLAQLDAVEAQCKVLWAALEALAQQVRALRAAVLPEPEAPAKPACPRCRSTILARAGDVDVCGDCGANFRGTEVLNG